MDMFRTVYNCLHCSLVISYAGVFSVQGPMADIRVLNERNEPNLTEVVAANEKWSRSLEWPPQQRSGIPKLQEKQFLQPRPRPFLPFRLTPAALLIPAIPTLVGTHSLSRRS